MINKFKPLKVKQAWNALPAQRRNASIAVIIVLVLFLSFIASRSTNDTEIIIGESASAIATVDQAVNIQDLWLYRSQDRLEEQTVLLEALQAELDSLKSTQQLPSENLDDLDDLREQINAIKMQMEQSAISSVEQNYQTPGFGDDMTLDAIYSREPKILSQSFTLQEKANLAKTSDDYIPLGSFAEAILLNGLDASTSTSASTNPLPVLMRLTSDAVLPRQFKGQMKTCHVIAGAYGELSTTRVMMRLETITCTDLNGEIFESEIEGYVTGDDGRVGVLGTLRDDTGPLLTRSFAAGVLGGIGQGIADSTGTTSTSALGTVTSYDTGEILKLGLGEGSSRALDRLAQYYIDRAEQIYPVIQIEPGRKIVLVISGSQGLVKSKEIFQEHEQ